MIALSSRKRRVVVTGVGVISPVGKSKASFWQSLVAGQSGIVRSQALDGAPCDCVGEIRDFQSDLSDFGQLGEHSNKSIRKALKLMNRETQMAVAAAQQAIDDSQLVSSVVDPERVGVCLGAGVASLLPEDFLAAVQSCRHEEDTFDFSRWGTDGIAHVAPLWMLKCLPNMAACQLAVLNQVRGPNNTITQREVSANLALTEAYNLIADDEADMMITGAAGTTILPINMIHATVDAPLATSGPDPTRICRPFDRDRKGMVLGEGAAVVILEEMTRALRRSAKLYGEILGYGSSFVARGSGAGNCCTALANAMRAALRKASLSPSDLGHINSHGLSTRDTDIDEARAIREVFGAQADRLPVVAAKSYVGNAGAGSGAMELAASLLALQHQKLFPVLNYETPDRDCRIAPVTAEEEAGSSFINLSLVPDGCASCVLIGAVN